MKSRYYEVVDDVITIYIDGRFEQIEKEDVPSDATGFSVVEFTAGEVLENIETTKIGKFLLDNELVIEQL